MSLEQARLLSANRKLCDLLRQQLARVDRKLAENASAQRQLERLRQQCGKRAAKGAAAMAETQPPREWQRPSNKKEIRPYFFSPVDQSAPLPNIDTVHIRRDQLREKVPLCIPVKTWSHVECELLTSAVRQ